MFEIVLANDYATLKDRISELEAQLLELQTDTAPVIVTWTIETVAARAGKVANLTEKMVDRLTGKLLDGAAVADAVEYATGSRTARRSLLLIDALS